MTESIIIALILLCGNLYGFFGGIGVLICKDIKNTKVRLLMDIMITIAMVSVAFLFEKHFGLVLGVILATYIGSLFAFSIVSVTPREKDF